VPWPAWYRTLDVSRGTCYIPSYEFPRAIERHARGGSAWRYQHQWTTYCPNRKVAFKAIDRLGLETESEFWSLMHAAQESGLAPPTSYANLFLSCYRAPMPRVSVIAPFVGFRFGGWQEAFRRGSARGPVYQYDLNKAYRWSASRGMPDLRDATPTWDFSAPSAVYLVRDVPVGAIPYRRVPTSSVHLITSEERDALGLEQVSGITVLRGFRFTRMIDLSETFAELDRKFPAPIVARICRAFWGMWNTTTAPEIVTWKSGERTRTMRNPWYNPIWSAFITSRVKLRLNLHRGRMLHCFVDSVHVTDELETGDQPGDWRHVGTYQKFWCRAPGQWGDGDYTLKYTGRGSVMLSPYPLRK